MGNDTSITTKFKVDISDLKKGITDANKNIKLANAQFKSATAGMDDWQKSSDGLGAKLKQLQSILQSESGKLKSYKEQLNKVQEAESENARRVEEAKKAYQEIVNQYGANSNEAKKYAKALNDCEKEQKANAAAGEKLQITILNQTATVKKLSKDYKTYSTRLNELENDSKQLDASNAKLSNSFKDVGNSAKDAEKGTSDLSEGFTIAKGAIASLIADGIRNLVSNLKDLALESGKAYNTFQTKTGASAEEMKKFKGVMDELYEENYGESLTDIANAMAEVKQQTQETDPSKLKELTKYAILLSDTFEFDVKESTRTANMLMKQFGLTGEESFNLIAQGAQKGLDKNGDLLDTLNEYAPYYKRMGYSAEEFMNALVNGTEAGTFSVDKLGDAFKEFNIRAQDTAASTTEGFELIGLNADKMRKKFAQGGEVAKKATEETVAALFGLNDEVKRNQAGVDLFGTMWEDLGETGIRALMNVNGEINKSSDALKKIDSTKYSDLGSQVQETGRYINNSLIQPIGTKLMPILNDLLKSTVPPLKKFLSFSVKNIKPIGSAVAGVTTAVVAYKGAQKASNIMTTAANTINKLYAARVTANTAATIANSTATEGATIATKLLGIAQMATPWGLVAGLIGGVTVALGTYIAMQSTTKTKSQEMIDSANEEIEARKKIIDSQNETVANGASEIGYLQSLKDELNTLVGVNGQVDESNRNRANFILTQLNEALGTEISLNDVLNGKYDELSGKIDKLIEKKKAQLILESQEEAYKNAIENITKAKQDLVTAEENYNSVKEKQNKKIRELEGQLASETNEYTRKTLQDKIDAAKADIINAETAYDKKKEIAQGYVNDIATYEQDSADFQAGNYENLNKRIANSYKDGNKEIKIQLNDKLKAEQANLELLEELYANTGEERYKTQIEASKKTIDQLKQDIETQKSLVLQGGIEYSEAWKNFGKAGQDGLLSGLGDFNAVGQRLVQAVSEGTATAEQLGVDAINRVGDNMILTLNGKDYLFNGSGQYLGSQTTLGIGSGIENGKPYVLDKTTRLKDGVLQTYKNGKWVDAGANAVFEIAKGTEINGEKTKHAMRILADGTVEEYQKGSNGEKGKWVKAGKATTDGVKLGIDLGNGTVTTSFGRVAINALDSFKRVFGIASPSKVMKKMGKFIDEGAAIGVEKNGHLGVKAMKSMALNMLDSFKGNVKNAINPNALKSQLAFANSGVNASIQNTKGMIGNVGLSTPKTQVINFTQNNTSPKALSRRDIYRQSKNASELLARRLK